MSSVVVCVGKSFQKHVASLRQVGRDHAETSTFPSNHAFMFDCMHLASIFAMTAKRVGSDWILIAKTGAKQAMGRASYLRSRLAFAKG
jgi:hypothetical protein